MLLKNRFVIISVHRSKCCGDMTIFRFFKMAAAAILDFQNFKLLTVGRLNRVKMRRRGKFGQNWSNRGRDMTIFRFFKTAADPYRNPLRGFGAPGSRNLPIPITLAIGFYNSLHYRASRDQMQGSDILRLGR